MEEAPLNRALAPNGVIPTGADPPAQLQSLASSDAASEKVPVGQAVQVVKPEVLPKVEVGQGLHIVNPVEDAKWPSAQLSQAETLVWPVSLLYFPVPQLMQAAAPALPYLPATQVRQAESDVWPVAELNFPAPQTSQAAEDSVAALYWPARHAAMLSAAPV